MSFGVTASLPQGAVFMADFKDPERSFASGWEGMRMEPLYEFQKMSGSGQVAVFTQAKLEFGIEIEGAGKVDVEFDFKLPQLATTFSAAYAENGLCGHGQGVSRTGVTVTTALSVELWLEVNAGVGWVFDPRFSRRFFNLTEMLDERCFPLEIPGLDGGFVGGGSSEGGASGLLGARTALLTMPSASSLTLGGQSGGSGGSVSVSVPVATPIRSVGLTSERGGNGSATSGTGYAALTSWGRTRPSKGSITATRDYRPTSGKSSSEG